MRRLRMGMIGGGPGAFIGPVHRFAAELDREIELVAGVFSSDAGRSAAAGESYRIDSARAYPSLEAMFAGEAARDDGIDFVSIVTPNHNHLPSARAALAAGYPVITDKPLTATLDEAHQLAGVVAAAGKPFGVTYTYSGYPLVREARARVAAGEIGTVRKVVVEYPQGWLAGPAEGKQAEWRVDPARAGLGGCIGDIGVHAFQLAEFVTGLRVTELLADLGSVVPGRLLDDDCSILLRFENGARGVLLASQIEVGELNGLRIRAYGDMGGIVWRQEEPNTLTISRLDGTCTLVRSGTGVLGADAASRTRTPGGHPEGYLEAFANLYRDFAAIVRGDAAPLLPGIAEGVRGMTFIHKAVTASRENAGWVKLED
ncbi:oxidoreductase-like protein [Novosphingobium aromaticivorans DSM 12444]|uniref:Oxidoreductase-like protein n=1 Tax=Novosphingobium aromaticivorans (strain ATCC 700278 / DSM 12444 / CCUG 56034 / CIP 105152 / NBRC 16084 / F199) TaxID=279238 RepID=Q2GB73_NOVAD|nr:Gfo/Idh/MocA family oxidoreductase [Novosphingobium aromaticivorans]ABD24900.1 oxidoreductase-like protein [Novosphingobium aromaticivorans DSM 12444]SCY14097.1 Predicted dehydrogenase [Novosphingobium aromaticivorans]